MGEMEQMDRDAEAEWFVIQLAVVGSPEHVIAAAIPNVQEELNQRDYLRTRQVAWGPQEQRVIVDVEDRGYDPQRTAEGMAEELFEIAASVLGDFETFHIDIVSMRRPTADADSSDDT